MSRLVAVLGGLVAVAVLATEATMRPTGSERLTLIGIFALAALFAVALARLVPWVGARFHTLRAALVLTVAAAVVVAAVTVILSAGFMFISSHDLRLALVALGLGIGLGAAVGGTLAGRLTADLRSMAEAAERIGAGDLTARTGVDRPDELGEAARSLDMMVDQLEAARHERDTAEAARRLFMAAVGHDLRTPLTSMRAALEAIQDGISPDPQRYLAAMDRDLDFIGSMVEDFFLLARIDAGKLDLDAAPVDLAEVADEVVEAMAPVAARRRIRVELKADGRVRVRGGSQELARAVRNLLENAVRHAPDDSTVRVSVEGDDRAVELRVVDEGPGFAPGLAERAFDLFTRGDPARQRASGGAGLGLAIARGVIEAHGGRVWVEDGPGGRVALRLPVSPA